MRNSVRNSFSHWWQPGFKGYKDSMIFCVFIFYFFRTNGTNGKRTAGWERLPSPLWYFFESTILKLLEHSYVQSSFATTRMHFDNGIWNAALKLKILRTWISIGTNYFLRKFLETKIDESAWKIINTIIRACSSKNIAPSYFTYHCMLLFLSNKPDFSIQHCVVPAISATIHLSFLTFDVLCILKLIQSLHVFLITISKILMRLHVVFMESLQPQNVLVIFLFSMKHSYLLTLNTPPDVYNSLIFTWYERATAGNSLHVRSNFFFN